MKGLIYKEWQIVMQNRKVLVRTFIFLCLLSIYIFIKADDFLIVFYSVPIMIQVALLQEQMMYSIGIEKTSTSCIKMLSLFRPYEILMSKIIVSLMVAVIPVYIFTIISNIGFLIFGKIELDISFLLGTLVLNISKVCLLAMTLLLMEAIVTNMTIKYGVYMILGMYSILSVFELECKQYPFYVELLISVGIIIISAIELLIIRFVKSDYFIKVMKK